jgi:hypothetical protein
MARMPWTSGRNVRSSGAVPASLPQSWTRPSGSTLSPITTSTRRCRSSRQKPASPSFPQTPWSIVATRFGAYLVAPVTQARADVATGGPPRPVLAGGTSRVDRWHGGRGRTGCGWRRSVGENARGMVRHGDDRGAAVASRGGSLTKEPRELSCTARRAGIGCRAVVRGHAERVLDPQAVEHVRTSCHGGKLASSRAVLAGSSPSTARSDCTRACITSAHTAAERGPPL